MQSRVLQPLLRLLISLLILAPTAYARPAKKLVINEPDTTSIDLNTDHYSVSVVDGWVSSRDGVMRRLFSSTSRLTISFKATLRLSNGTSLDLSNIYEAPGVSGNLNQPLGVNVKFLDNIPGDATAHLTVRLIVPHEDRGSQILQAAEQSKVGLPADLLASPWIGYSKLIDGLINQVFGTSADSYPFHWDGDINLGGTSMTPLHSVNSTQ